MKRGGNTGRRPLRADILFRVRIIVPDSHSSNPVLKGVMDFLKLTTLRSKSPLLVWMRLMAEVAVRDGNRDNRGCRHFKKSCLLLLNKRQWNVRNEFPNVEYLRRVMGISFFTYDEMMGFSAVPWIIEEGVIKECPAGGLAVRGSGC